MWFSKRAGIIRVVGASPLTESEEDLDLSAQPYRRSKAEMQLVEKYRPRTIDDFAGLAKVKPLMNTFAASPYESAWLFHGDTGLGKTEMGMVLASAISAQFHHIPSQECDLQRVRQVSIACQHVPMWGKKFHLVLVDEADSMSTAAQVSLLSSLDNTGRSPNTIWVFTSNSKKGLEPRFLSRCHKVEFSNYGMQPCAVELMKGIWDKESQTSCMQLAGQSRPNFKQIAKESKGNVRECLMRVEAEIIKRQSNT
jgi:replication-associated recombination protein RarA